MLLGGRRRQVSIRVLIVDDQITGRVGARTLLRGGRTKGFAIVGEAASGEEALKGLLDTKPDVMLVDTEMPAMSGAEYTRRALKKMPGVRALAFSGFADGAHLLAMLHAGADGYILKTCKPSELREAVSAVARGGYYLSSDMLGLAIEACRQQMLVPEPSLIAALTKREREALRLVSRGMHSKDVALKLGIDKRTVDSHREHIMKKLKVNHIPGLVKLAIRAGLDQL
jgi:DNA-binding NarL/FixJ family response regulator